MWNPNYDTNELIHEIETLTDTVNKPVVAKAERRWGREKLEVWDWQMKPIAYRMDEQYSPLYSMATVFSIL